MQSFCGTVRLARRHAINGSKIADCKSFQSRPVTDVRFIGSSIDCSEGLVYQTLRKFTSHSPLALIKTGIKTDLITSSNNGGMCSLPLLDKAPRPGLFHQSMAVHACNRTITTMNNSSDSITQDASACVPGVAPRIKFKRLDKTARHIMQILDKEAVEEVREQREIPDIKPGHIIQLKVEVPDNKRRVSILKGIVIARRNAGLNSTFRLRRLVAGVGVESLFPLYSPNIKEIKVLDKKKVRRAKLYYLRDKMNALRK